jgi:tRNA-intron endonuclease, archaea type
MKGDKVQTKISGDFVLTEDSNEARELNNRSLFGTLLENNQVQITFLEAAYLLEKEKITVLDRKGKELSFEDFLRKAKQGKGNFWTRYCVFRDMRNRGYIVKTALKFGADFRVYARGVRPGEDHAKWILFPVEESSAMTWYDFSAKNRVAHSTRKNLLIAVVDEENDVSYWEVRWTRP